MFTTERMDMSDRRGSMGRYLYPLNEVSAGAKAERVDSARSMSFSCTSLSFSCTLIYFSVISKFDSFILGGSKHLLCLYSLRSLILR